MNTTLKNPFTLFVNTIWYQITDGFVISLAFSNLVYMAPSAFAAKYLDQGSGTLCLSQDKVKTCEILS